MIPGGGENAHLDHRFVLQFAIGLGDQRYRGYRADPGYSAEGDERSMLARATASRRLSVG